MRLRPPLSLSQAEALDADALVFAPHVRHVVLVREPRRLLASFHAKVKGWGADAAASVDETGYADLVRLHAEARARHAAGRCAFAPVVVLSDAVQARPEASLRALCRALGLAFEPAMLAWPAGPKACDGIWAYHWCARARRADRARGARARAS